MSWVKFSTYIAILACSMFLHLQLKDTQGNDAQVGSMRALLSPPMERRSILQQEPYSLLATGSTSLPDSPKTPSRQDTVLGAIYLTVAVLSFVVSTHDYYTCIRQLEVEHTYLDECEGHTHPLVTILSCAIGVVIMATVLLMLVQREV